MIQTVREKNRYTKPETEAVTLRMEPLQGFCSDIRQLNPDDDTEIP